MNLKPLAPQEVRTECCQVEDQGQGSDYQVKPCESKPQKPDLTNRRKKKKSWKGSRAVRPCRRKGSGGAPSICQSKPGPGSGHLLNDNYICSNHVLLSMLQPCWVPFKQHKLFAKKQPKSDTRNRKSGHRACAPPGMGGGLQSLHAHPGKVEQTQTETRDIAVECGLSLLVPLP